MKFFTPPKTEYIDYYDISKFNLIWNFSISISFLLIILIISNYNNENYSLIPVILAITICTSVILLLYKTRKFKTISILAIVSAFILNSLTFFLQRDVLHFTTTMWMMLNILISFFMLGRKWGTRILIAHHIILFFYFYYFLESNIAGLKPFNTEYIWNFIIESTIIGVGICYILIQYIKTTKHAKDEMKAVNDSLLDKNELISKQNKEKEVMLKEIHHRVKNNLQIITSILRLQSHDIENEKVSAPFEEAINRISSISLIHEKMYQSDALSNFDLESHFKSLSMTIIANYRFQKEIDIDIQSTLSMTHSNSIVPLAMLYNELITNSVKHAFKDVEDPEISVAFNPIDNACFKMNYSDNGQWKENSTESFGTELILAMTEQLEGKYTLEKTTSGTFYQFTFSIMED